MGGHTDVPRGAAQGRVAPADPLQQRKSTPARHVCHGGGRAREKAAPLEEHGIQAIQFHLKAALSVFHVLAQRVPSTHWADGGRREQLREHVVADCRP